MEISLCMIVRDEEKTLARCLDSVQLCVLLERMARTREAAQENERALIDRSGEPAALKNRAYFAGRLCGAEA